jgi:hypothetical protein
MVLSSLQKRLENIQNHITHSSPSYSSSSLRSRQLFSHTTPTTHTNTAHTNTTERATDTDLHRQRVSVAATAHDSVVAKEKEFPWMEDDAAVAWTESFLDALPVVDHSDGHGHGDAGEDEDEGIWPNDWPSVILSSPQPQPQPRSQRR